MFSKNKIAFMDGFFYYCLSLLKFTATSKDILTKKLYKLLYIENIILFLQNFKKNALTLRLTILYTLSTFSALSVSSIFLYHLLVSDLYSSDQKIVDNEIRLLQDVLRTHRGKIIMLDPQSNQRKTYYVRVLNTKGETLLETPGMNLEFSQTDFAPVLPNMNISKIQVIKTVENRYYMTRTASVIIPDENAFTLTIQMALDTNHHHSIKIKYQIRLAIILLAGIFISSILGVFIAYKGMKPLRRLTRKVQSINASQLHERIDTTDCPAELIALVDAFNALLTRIERSFNQLKQFSADIAHELRTPLHHLMVETEICLSQKRELDEYQETLQSSLEEYNSLAQLIDRLLFLARAENPKTEVTLSEIDIEAEFHALLEFYQLACEEKHITLKTQGEGKLLADPILFRRAVNNLLTNAIKHTLAGGTVQLIASKNEKYHTISVIDTGIGIEESHLAHLFDRFYRVDYSRSKQAGGHGLGLAIVKSIMTLHHGEVSVSSQIGEGSIFKLLFPLKI